MHPLIPWFEPPAFSLDLPKALADLFGTPQLTIHGFGILVAMGFVLGSAVGQRKAFQFTGDKTAPDRLNRLVTWLILGTFVGGHVGHLVMYEPAKLMADPGSLLRVWEGLSSYGGFAVCVPITIWFMHRERKPYWPIADAVAIGVALGWFFGRLGCFSAHDHAGTQTNFWLGVYGMCPGGNKTIACHDLGLYEAIWSGSVFLLFMGLSRKLRFPGFYVGMLALLYGPLRFVSDFFRNVNGPDVRYAGLTPAQYGSILVSALGIWVLVTRSRAPVAVPAPA